MIEGSGSRRPKNIWIRSELGSGSATLVVGPFVAGPPPPGSQDVGQPGLGQCDLGLPNPNPRVGVQRDRGGIWTAQVTGRPVPLTARLMTDAPPLHPHLKETRGTEAGKLSQLTPLS
jgi:hypothetical protein